MTARSRVVDRQGEAMLLGLRYSLFVVPRTEKEPELSLDAAFALKGAVEEAGLEFGLPELGVVQVAGHAFRVLPIAVVRERDAVLIAHLQGSPSPGGKGLVVGSGQNDAEILWRAQGHSDEPMVVVANRISASAREELSRSGVAWLDRRGHLWFKAPGVYVNAEVSPSVAPPPRVVDVLSGTGLDVALALLTAPDQDAGVNELGRRIRRSPGRVSEILGALRTEGLVEGGNRPAVPELFWDVADRWKPRRQSLSAVPSTDGADRYRLSGTLAALELGAPLVAASSRSLPSLYVGKASELTRLVDAYGRGDRAVAEAAVCPSRFGVTLGSGASRDGFPVAHPVVVALDLAQDRARGREILDAWNPEGAVRVW